MVRALSLSLTALLLASCASAPVEKAALPNTPAAFKGAAVEGPAAPVQQAGAWWLVFNDPVLNDLIGRSMGSNTDIATAEAHLTQARALLKAARSSFWPQAGVTYTAARGTDVLGTPLPQGKAANAHSLDLDLSYEVDLFGRLAKASQAAKLDARSAEDLLHDTQLLVQSRVAQSYFALRALDEDRAIVAETLDAYRGSLKVTKSRFANGDVAELDVARLETEVSATEAEALALDQQRAELANALSVLVGEPATTFDVKAQTWASQPWAGAVPVIPAGIPSNVLKRRPDVLAAEASMTAAERRVGVARAAWFPSLTLTGNGGYASTDLDTLFDKGSQTWSLAGILTQAVFDGGRRNANIDYAKGGMEASFAGYRQSVLVAFSDVEDQLSDLSYLRQQEAAEGRAVDASNRALRQAQSLYRNGSSSQLEMLDAQRQQLAVRRQALRVRAAQYQSTVGLIRALGGGWG
ncbi:efflux transporter outer membrane subunit [Asticcacaulis solisilvae]|uniref:efflux transporter outer membrane subunit n=1 Tax=Asticcacaulis solisilvae TaxID=1217274 RepID=UPI003FD8FC8F